MALRVRVSSSAPKKHLGQHFLTAPYYARRIAEAVPARADERVVEIGPGTGALTIHLAARFSGLHCVEKDSDVLPRLRAKVGDTCVIHQADILSFDLETIGFPLHAVGNLPYGVASLILRRVLSYGEQILSCTFMVQREVAERIVAGPGTRRNGFLSIFTQFYGTPRVLFHVPRGAFFPKPAVESSVFQLPVDRWLDRKLPPQRREDFFRFVDAAFRQRRKKLSKTLAAAYPGVDIEAAVREAGVGSMARPEELDVSMWLNLYTRAFS